MKSQSAFDTPLFTEYKISEYFKEQQQQADRILQQLADNPTALEIVAIAVSDRLLPELTTKNAAFRDSLRLQTMRAIVDAAKG